MISSAATLKGWTAVCQMSQSLQLGRITQLRARRMSFHVVNVERLQFTGRGVCSLKCQHLALHARRPEAATFAVGRHADTANDTQNRQAMLFCDVFGRDHNRDVTFGT
ncbi:MAG: hypothetical protein MUE88_05320, partial [Flavobacteriales bacterium]|nr:hypothetical protein [Flavobacteriales bacterium]